MWASSTRPLLIGESEQMRAGKEKNWGDCVPDDSNRFTWSTSDPDVVGVTDDSVVTGLAPGTFQLAAAREGVVLRDSGFVLPDGWSARISPDSAEVQVGDAVTYVVTPVDSLGRELPLVPFWLLTPEFERPGSGDRPLVDRWSHQGVSEPSTFRAVRSGRTTITGKIGDRRVTSDLVITD